MGVRVQMRAATQEDNRNMVCCAFTCFQIYPGLSHPFCCRSPSPSTTIRFGTVVLSGLREEAALTTLVLHFAPSTNFRTCACTINHGNLLCQRRLLVLLPPPRRLVYMYSMRPMRATSTTSDCTDMFCLCANCMNTSDVWGGTCALGGTSKTSGVL
jgi:hypothetical protein